MNKQKRRTKLEIEKIRNVIIAVLEEEKPMTVRQILYQLVSRDAIASGMNSDRTQPTND